MGKASKKKVRKPDTKDVAELKRAVVALQASQHNPVDWLPIVKFFAPIIARLVARQTARYLYGKLNKRLPTKIPGEAADVAADRIGDLVAKIVVAKPRTK